MRCWGGSAAAFRFLLAFLTRFRSARLSFEIWCDSNVSRYYSPSIIHTNDCFFLIVSLFDLLNFYNLNYLDSFGLSIRLVAHVSLLLIRSQVMHHPQSISSIVCQVDMMWTRLDKRCVERHRGTYLPLRSTQGQHVEVDRKPIAKVPLNRDWA